MVEEESKHLLKIKGTKWHCNGHTLHTPQGAKQRHALDFDPQGTKKRSRPKTTWKKEYKMGTVEGSRKLEGGKSTSL